MFRDLKGDDSEDNGAKSDNDTCEDCVSLGHQESNIGTVWSLCQTCTSTGRQW